MLHNGHAVPRASAGREKLIVQAAFDVADQGYEIFFCDQLKRPTVKKWQNVATRDPAMIRRLSSEPRAALIAAKTGAFIVIDVDSKNGARGMEWFESNRDALPPTRTHRTRSGGLHLFFLPLPDFEIRNSTSRLAAGVDVRGGGGYIIMPPSPGYTVLDTAPVAELPRWLARACTAHLAPEARPAPPPRPRQATTAACDRRWALAALQRECDAVRRAPFGEQETTLNTAGFCIGQIVGFGLLSEVEALHDLLSAAHEMRNQPGREKWTSVQLQRKLERALSDGRRKPRGLGGRTAR